MKSEIFSIPQNYVFRYYYNDQDKYLPWFRTPFMRDRDRVMYSTAFRRLAGKTQIYTIGSDDHKKNRLTHSLEVSEVARTIAQALDLKTDLTEAIALAHDFGHTPFGHAGEEILNSIITPNSEYICGSPYYNKTENQIQDELDVLPNSFTDICNFDRMFGFKHNIQSLRVTCVIEDSYRGPNGKNIGLNLTNYTLWGILNHSKIKYKNGDPYPNYQKQFERFINIPGLNKEAWSLEGYIVRISDDIAQWHHDLEDALRGNAIPLVDICQTILDALGTDMNSYDKKSIENIKAKIIADRKTVTEIAHIVINTLVNNVCETSERNLQQIFKELKNHFPDKSDTEIANLFYSQYDDLGLTIDKDKIIVFSDSINQSKFKDVIRNRVHHSFDVERMNFKGKYIIRKLFEAYFNSPQQLPDGYVFHYMVDIGEYENIDKAINAGSGHVRNEFSRIVSNPNLIQTSILMRRICDHIACMTDNYAIDEYHKLYG